MPPCSRPASPPGTIRDVSYIALFAALTAIGAFIRIPIPVCPFTLQLLACPYLLPAAGRPMPFSLPSVTCWDLLPEPG